MTYTHSIVKWCKFVNIWSCNAFCFQYTTHTRTVIFVCTSVLLLCKLSRSSMYDQVPWSCGIFDLHNNRVMHKGNTVICLDWPQSRVITRSHKKRRRDKFHVKFSRLMIFVQWTVRVYHVLWTRWSGECLRIRSQLFENLFDEYKQCNSVVW